MSRNVIWGYRFFIVVNSLLLFILQPLIAKSLLPQYGGTASVIAGCMVFFQGILLLGYGYGSLMQKHLSLKFGLAVHSLLILISLLCLVFAAEPFWQSQHPWVSLLGDLLPWCMPYLVLSSGSVVLSQYYALQFPKKDAYKLYAYSNAGSIGGIFLGLILIIPNVALSQHLLEVQLILAIFLLSLAAFLIWQAVRTFSNTIVQRSDTTPWARKSILYILIESAVPAALLVAMTSYFASFLGANVFLWLVLLGLYLLAYILVYAKVSLPFANFWSYGALILFVMSLLRVDPSEPIVLVGYCLGFLFICYGLFQQVYSLRPNYCNLGRFYCLQALGGFIGSILVSLIFPIVFESFIDLSLLLVLCRFLYRPLHPALQKTKMSENARPKWIALAVVLMICVGLEMKNARNTLWMGRGFYGPLKVRFLGESGVRELLHGHTSHGKQDFKSPESPLSYYSQESGLGVVLGHTEWNRLAAIGMGAGVLASYGKKGQQIDFYELDPLVVKVAKNPELFSYLSDAKQRGVHVKTTLGDGRIELSKAREAYDIIVIDAFQSSAIPVHLVTQEAIDIYLAKLKPNGKLLFHVSGSELNYSALLQSQFAVFGLQFYKYIDQGRGLHKDASIWVMGKYTDHNFEKGLTSLTHRGLGPTWTDASHNIWDLF